VPETKSSIPVLVRFPPDLLEEIDAHRSKREKGLIPSRSGVIRDAVKFYLKPKEAHDPCPSES
jgi:metal-responsive CopG/Arc/MetJ family transcriptional regulator